MSSRFRFLSFPTLLAVTVVLLLAACNPPPPSSIDVAVDPANVSVEQGQDATADVTVTGSNFTGTVTLGLEGEPAGVEGTFDPNPVTASTGDLLTHQVESTLTLSAEAGATVGDFDLTITAEGTGVDGTAELGLEVTAAMNPNGDFNPTTDTTIPGGNVPLDSIDIPAGVTITVASDTVFDVSGDVTIDGTLVGDCTALELNVGGAADVTGRIENSCSGGDPAQDVLLVVDGGLELGASGGTGPVVVSDGNIDITDTDTKDEPLEPLAMDVGLARRSGANAGLGPSQGPSMNINQPLTPGRGGRIRITSNNDININASQTAGDGKDGNDQTIDGTCDGSGEKGSSGGTISIASRTGTLTFAAGVDLTAGNGGKGGSCVAPSGCPATAVGGNGGRGGSVLVGAVVITFNGNALNRGNGGMGGNADATGDDGVGCESNGCDAFATGGKGGAAGGIGTLIVEPGTINGNATEGGGDGGEGGEATAEGGNGGDCNDCTIGDGGDGGEATATGGQGGNGATAAIYPVVAGTHKKGDGGEAFVLGGHGGAGASCCKFQPGGDGGDGGDASATGGAIGARGMNAGTRGAVSPVSAAGDGGDGGDGNGPGAGGAEGIGSGDPTAVPDGLPGDIGDPCPVSAWYIYFSDIPDMVILPGTVFTLNTYETNDPPGPANAPTGEVDTTFLEAADLGALGFPAMQPQYQKQGDNVLVAPDAPGEYFAGFAMDLTKLQDFPVDQFQINVAPQQPGQGGVLTILGHGESGEVIQRLDMPIDGGREFDTAILPPPPPESGEEVYTAITVIADFPFFFFHWWVIIIDP